MSLPSPSPRLPLELLTLILSHAFLPSSSLSPLLAPPPAPTHLLLISRSLYTIALPFLYRIITLRRPRDWLLLFDRDTGLCSAGVEGRKRWSWVRELHLCLETARVPVKRGWIMHDEDEDVLSPLRIPDTHQLSVLSLVHPHPRTLPLDPSEDESNDLSLTAATLASPLGLATLKHVLATQHGSLASVPGFLEGELSIATKVACLLSRVIFWVYLLARTTPRTITGSLALFRALRLSKIGPSPLLGYSDEYGNSGPRVIVYAGADDEEAEADGRKGFEPFWEVQRMIVGTEMRLVGFGEGRMEGLRGWWMERRRRRREGGNEEGGGGPAEETGSWGWQREDGEVVVVRMGDWERG